MNTWLSNATDTRNSCHVTPVDGAFRRLALHTERAPIRPFQRQRPFEKNAYGITELLAGFRIGHRAIGEIVLGTAEFVQMVAVETRVDLCGVNAGHLRGALLWQAKKLAERTVELAMPLVEEPDKLVRHVQID